MHDVMVSYSHADATFTRTLVLALRDAGLSVWIDEEALTGGVRSLEEIGKAVCECRCVVPVLSSKRVESKWCTDELGLAYSNRKLLFPVTCEPFGQIKLSYADKLILNGVQWECAAGSDSDARLQVLIGRIKKSLGPAGVARQQSVAQDPELGGSAPFWPRSFGESTSSVTWDKFAAAFEAECVAAGGIPGAAAMDVKDDGVQQSVLPWVVSLLKEMLLCGKDGGSTDGGDGGEAGEAVVIFDRFEAFRKGEQGQLKRRTFLEAVSELLHQETMVACAAHHLSTRAPCTCACATACVHGTRACLRARSHLRCVGACAGFCSRRPTAPTTCRTTSSRRSRRSRR